MSGEGPVEKGADVEDTPVDLLLQAVQVDGAGLQEGEGGGVCQQLLHAAVR
jgi:hypothetical protein